MTKLLCITRENWPGQWDVAALRDFSTMDIYTYPLEQLDKDQRNILPKAAQFQRKYDQHRGDREAWERAVRLGEGLLLSARGRPDAVVSQHWEYWPDECVRLACRQLNIPFITLFHEHFCASIASTPPDKYYEHYDLKPNVSGLAVAGQVTKDILVKAGVFPAAKVEVTGWPRLDYWLRGEYGQLQDSIVLLSYGDGYMAPKNYKETLQIFCEEARIDKSRRYILRVKNMADAEGVKPPVIVDAYSPTWQVLDRAQIVVGYNSLALVEAFLSRARVVVPRWKDAVRPLSRTVVHPSQGVPADFPDSPEELRMILRDEWRAATPRPGVVQGVMCYDERQTASARFQRFVEDCIYEARS